tara:strand:+ start:1973 stop:2401 length:429 start_codon:yes stop_codon:yes gene_type:complete
MITETAKRKIALFLKELYNTANVGVGGNASNPNSDTLDVPILGANKTITVSESSANVLDFTATFTGSELDGNTVREFGVFGTLPTDSSFGTMIDNTRTSATGEDTDSAYSTETTMLARVNFDALGTFASSDELEITLTVEVE